VFALLLRSYGTLAVSAYLVAALCISGVAVGIARETYRLPLE